MRSLIGKVLDLGTARGGSPVPYTGRRGSTLGTAVTSGGGGPLARMRQVGTLFAVVNRTSTATAAVDWTLYRKPATTKPDPDADRETVAVHAAAALWAQWNPHMTGAEGVEVGQQHIDLAGETFLIVVRVGGVPVEIWPVRPDRMQENPHPTKFLVGWIYKSPDGEKIPLRTDEVIQVKTPDPENPYRGLSPLPALITELDSAAAASRWNANFFENSAQPGGIIEVPESLSDDEFDEMTERWNEQHRGVMNAHRVAIIEHGQWKGRAFSPKELELSALRNVSRDAILEAYGMSRATLGITDGVNFAAAKAAKAQFAELLTVPRCERWKAALNHRLLPMFGATGKGVEFDYENPAETDPEAENAERDSRVQAAVALIEAGFNPKSVCEALGLPEMQFGNGDPDPDRDLMVQLVTAAPAALASMLLPILLPNVEFPQPAPAEPEPDPEGDPEDEPGEDDVQDDVPVPPGATQDDHDLAAAGTRLVTLAEAREIAQRVLEENEARRQQLVDDEAVDDIDLCPTCATGARIEQTHPPCDVQAADDDGPSGLLKLLQEAWERALDFLLGRWKTVQAEQRGELRDQIRDAIDDDDYARLDALTVGFERGAEILTEALDAIARVGAAHVVAEAAEQGVDITAVSPPVAELRRTADTIAALLGAAHALTAGQEAVRVAAPGMTGEQVAAAVDTHLRGLSDAGPRTHLGGALTGAQNRGMRDTYAGAADLGDDELPGPVGSIYHEGQLDKNQCDRCKAATGRFICTTEDLGPYERIFTALGGYVECRGRERCRCTATGVWRPATTKEDS